MKKLMLAVGLLAVAGSALAAKPCEELKAEIDVKIKANDVPAYTPEIADKDSVTDKRIVGIYDGGTKKAAYQRSRCGVCDEQYPGPAFPWESVLSFYHGEYSANDGSCCSSLRKRTI